MYDQAAGSVTDRPQDDDARAIYLMDHPDSTEEIPLIDIADYLAGVPGSRARIAAELRHATEKVGFFYLAGHGVSQNLIDRMFNENKRFFDLPLEEKQKIPRRLANGYIPLAANLGNGRLLGNIRPNLFEGLQIGPERSPDDPKVLAGQFLKYANVWPDNLPGFRENVLEYFDAVWGLGMRVLDLWAASLDLPQDYFLPFFQDPKINIRLTYYPTQPELEVGQRQYGLSPHTDNAMMTILAHGNVPGLAVRMPSGHWKLVEIKPGTFVVNTGDLMVRWTNDRYLSTKHRVINLSGDARYTFPVFFTPDMEAPIECLPSCQSPSNPPKYPPTTCEDICRAYFKD